MKNMSEQKEGLSEWMNERKDGWYEQKEGRKGYTNEWMDEWINSWKEAVKKKELKEWINEWSMNETKRRNGMNDDKYDN